MKEMSICSIIVLFFALEVNLRGNFPINECIMETNLVLSSISINRNDGFNSQLGKYYLKRIIPNSPTLHTHTRILYSPTLHTFCHTIANFLSNPGWSLCRISTLHVVRNHSQQLLRLSLTQSQCSYAPQKPGQQVSLWDSTHKFTCVHI